VLIDLGFDDAEELSAKAILAVKLNELIQSRGSVRPRSPRRPSPVASSFSAAKGCGLIEGNVPGSPAG